MVCGRRKTRTLFGGAIFCSLLTPLNLWVEPSNACHFPRTVMNAFESLQENKSLSSRPSIACRYGYVLRPRLVSMLNAVGSTYVNARSVMYGQCMAIRNHCPTLPCGDHKGVRITRYDRGCVADKWQGSRSNTC